MDLCYQTIERCVVAVALWLVMSAIDCEAVPSDTMSNTATRLAGWLLCRCAGGLVGLVGWVRVCLSGEDRE